MTHEKNVTVTFEQMKGAIGSLLFLWSQIEKELADSLSVLQDDRLPKATRGIARSIDLWSGEIQRRAGQDVLTNQLRNHLVDHLREALNVRNLVCHGLIGITARIGSADAEAHLTVKLDDVTRTLSWTELQSLFERMSKARSLIRDMTMAASNPVRGNALLQNWRDFPFQQ